MKLLTITHFNVAGNMIWWIRGPMWLIIINNSGLVHIFVLQIILYNLRCDNSDGNT